MKVVAKPISVVARFPEKGMPEPVKFRLKNEDDSYTNVMIDKIIQSDMEKLAGNLMIVFRCQSLIGGVTKLYELKYELNTCKWVLFKI